MKRRTLLNCIFLLILFLLCSGVLVFTGIFYTIPSRAQQAFGPPAKNLDFLERTYLSTLLILNKNEMATSLDPNGVSQTFNVALGEPTISIVQRLKDEGLIQSEDAFRRYLVYSGMDTSIQAGEYNISPSMTGLEIARALQDPTPTHVKFNILPGWRIEEIASALPTSGLGFSPQEFLAAARTGEQSFAFSSKLPLGSTLEGFFFPDLYQLPRTVTVDEFIKTILENFDVKLTPAIQQGFNRQGLDIYQAVTLASIVQREAMSDDEMPKIASVFLNRLRADMSLDSDPTVQYAIGFNLTQNTWWTNPLSLEDLKLNSPYNTYLYPSLPPGPISNPGLAALNAVAFPAETPYFYFRAACDGSGRHLFAKTLEEQLGNACP
jgi:UPF0755 protein